MDFTGLSEEELKEKLTAAQDYDERSAIRAELRKLKKNRGIEVAEKAKRGASCYKRFGGTNDGATRPRAVTISVSSVSKSKQQPSSNTGTTVPAEAPPSSNGRGRSPITSPTLSNGQPSSSQSPAKSNSPSAASLEDETDYVMKDTTRTAVKTNEASSRHTAQQTAEFQGFKLRKTGLSMKDKGRGVSSNRTPKVVSPEAKPQASAPRSNKVRSTERSPDPARQPEAVSVDNIQPFLVAFVNKALSLDPALPSVGRPFYTTCSQPDVICSLINYAVPDTVDMRALSPNHEPDSMEGNMMLALESARAIGCRVADDSTNLISRGEPSAVRKLVLDIIRAHAVHMPNMEDEPAESFEDPLRLFRVLGLSSGDLHREATPEHSHVTSPTPAAMTTEKRSSFDTVLSYEERAALRRAERDERRRQREHN